MFIKMNDSEQGYDIYRWVVWAQRNLSCISVFQQTTSKLKEQLKINVYQWCKMIPFNFFLVFSVPIILLAPFSNGSPLKRRQSGKFYIFMIKFHIFRRLLRRIIIATIYLFAFPFSSNRQFVWIWRLYYAKQSSGYLFAIETLPKFEQIGK